ncbi:hypothetical protein E2F46_05865 [Luteimonas aestuarii]|uniref:Uncharacterized protein n=1 Tax=Luteimonas aestuarii TaxID=453837 RepID=A0A4V3AMA3_9GAMM|nr:hypothetical protein [Luteimonas aestuarii]TDK26122.1 hypothetical protein E2F46_05865 [Luteimonas aestuarii]
MGRLAWIGLLVLAGLSLWLLMGSGRVFGIDPGAIGMTLLVATTWGALHRLSSVPQGEFERGVSPGEWKAWIGLGFMVAATLYFATRLHGVAGGDVFDAPVPRDVARNLVLLLVAWIVLSQVVASRWAGRVQADERDRRIEAQAGDWGRTAMVFVVIGLAVLFGFSPAERLQWATHAMIANLLVFALLWGWLVEHAAMAWMYAWDRRRNAA